MIKGVMLSVSFALFVTSLVFFFSGISGILQPNIFTGAVVGTDKVTGISFWGILFFGLASLILLKEMKD